MKTRFWVALAMVAATPAHAVYKCEAKDVGPKYQDLPCIASERMTLISRESGGTPAGMKAIAADEAKDAVARAAADSTAKASADEKIRKAEMAKAVEGGMASRRQWDDAKDRLKVGMTAMQMYALSPRFHGARSRTMEYSGGTDEWLYLDDDHLAIHLRNGVIDSIHHR